MADNGTGGSTSVDLATILGLVGAFGLIIAAMVLGGSPGSFIDIPSILIVIGGTIMVTMVSFSVGDMVKAAKVIAKTFIAVDYDASGAAHRVMQLSEMARKKGVLSLQGVVESLNNEPFLYKAVSMVVDGTPGDEVELVMRRDLTSTVVRHQKSVAVLKRAAEVSPAMGLIGTLIGLVQMLGNLDDPSTIGPSMAVALLTTFYGAILANMVFSPLASKLEKNSSEEMVINQVYLLGAGSIGRQENPRRLELLINSLLPPAQRISYFD
jgi:chemotaxis protein MotA